MMGSLAVLGPALARLDGGAIMAAARRRSLARGRRLREPQHHFVPERSFGRSANRQGTKTEGIFERCPWGFEGKSMTFCYECHEELLHNPVLLPEDIACFADLVESRGLAESLKSEDRSKIAGRVALFHEVIARGLSIIREEEQVRDGKA